MLATLIPTANTMPVPPLSLWPGDGEADPRALEVLAMLNDVFDAVFPVDPPHAEPV